VRFRPRFQAKQQSPLRLSHCRSRLIQLPPPVPTVTHRFRSLRLTPPSFRRITFLSSPPSSPSHEHCIFITNLHPASPSSSFASPSLPFGLAPYIHRLICPSTLHHYCHLTPLALPRGAPPHSFTAFSHPPSSHNKALGNLSETFTLHQQSYQSKKSNLTPKTLRLPLPSRSITPSFSIKSCQIFLKLLHALGSNPTDG